jgi:hypothetical protein
LLFRNGKGIVGDEGALKSTEPNVGEVGPDVPVEAFRFDTNAPMERSNKVDDGDGRRKVSFKEEALKKKGEDGGKFRAEDDKDDDDDDGVMACCCCC